jgi:hypothetical protein
MNLHPYDNVERHYRHTDGTRGDGREVVAQVLGLSELPAGELLFDMSFFSGGIGVLDRLAIALPADPVLWSSVVRSLRCRTPEEASTEESWRGQLIWLLTGVEERIPIRPAAVRFINRARREFQASARRRAAFCSGTRAT